MATGQVQPRNFWDFRNSPSHPRTQEFSDSRPVPFCITGELEVSCTFHRFAFPSSGNLYGSLPIRDARRPSSHQFLIVNLRYESKFCAAPLKSDRPLDRI